MTHMKPMKSCASRWLVAALVLGLPPVVQAQAYPAKPVRAIVPSGTAGTTNIAARAIAESLAASLGQPVIVDNRPGADGIIGMEACAKAAPDGYTLCFGQPAPLSIVPHVNAKLPYDPARDFAPVILVMVQSDVIVVGASLGAASLRELVDMAKLRPGAINWGTWGDSSVSNLYRAWIENRSGARFNHVPYKTPDQAQTALIAGEVDAMLANAALMQRQVQAGKLKALFVTGTRRLDILPGVPSFAELGFDLDFRGWVGVLAPAATPRAIVLRLNRETGRIIADPKFIQRFQAIVSVEPAGGSPEEFAAFLKADRETAGRLIRLANVRGN
jgi:tripartite-type tricarboxylate transporter receptor subunit TctC